jgi:hypothetical protein
METMRRSFYVVIGAEKYPLKDWARRNPAGLPPGIDLHSISSHRLRDLLNDRGWVIQEDESEVRLVRPAAGISDKAPETAELEAEVEPELTRPDRGAEKVFQSKLRVLLESRLNDYRVREGAPLPYKLEIGTDGSPSSAGKYAFKTDLLVEKITPPIPLVVIELKVRDITTHDIITYSHKAQRHEEIYPYLRYGLVVGQGGPLTAKFLTHNEAFDFALSIPNADDGVEALAVVLRRQLNYTNVLIDHLAKGRTAFTRYERSVEIE